jgi:two-component system, chemotaxis family, protein-glutamate methylesterase/glutaminase
VIAVLLAGNLHHGNPGMIAVRGQGGVNVVQDPADARYPGMPSSAIDHDAADHVAPSAEIGALIARLVRELPEHPAAVAAPELEVESAIAELDPAALAADDRPGRPSGFSCPECHGVLYEIEDGGLVRYRCRVGHAYGGETLLAEQADAVEAALWTAMKALKERAALTRKLARRLEAKGNHRSVRSFQEQAADADRMAEAIAGVLRSGAAPEAPHAHDLPERPPRSRSA